MKRRWLISEIVDNEVVTSLSQKLNLPVPLCKILFERGIRTYEDALAFFKPPFPDGIHSPFLMKNMEKAVDRIENAIKNKEKVLIYGDYDVDGVTSIALIYSFFKDFFAEIDFYVPHRENEGYGISQQAVEWAIEQGFTLMIALDCGIRDHKTIAVAQSSNLDVIICDHHLPAETLPTAFAILDPKQKDCPYPYKELSGCGVGFKLVQAFAEKNQIGLAKVCQYLDLLALSIAADVVPLTGENRLFSYYGLKLWNQRPRKNFEYLIVKSAIAHRVTDKNDVRTVFNREIDNYHLAFGIAPRINAAGRIGSAKDAVYLLIENENNTLLNLCEIVNNYNKERQDLEKKITQQAIEMIENNPNFKERKTIVLAHPQWKKGVVGIVAARLVELFYKPVIILAQTEKMLTGSGRSVKNFDIHNALTKCSDLLLHFGGHTAAAGMSLENKDLDIFTEKFEAVVSQSIQPEALTPYIRIDAEISSLDEIDFHFHQKIKYFAPFGYGNSSPIFMTKNVKDTGYAQNLKDIHLKMNLIQKNCPSQPVNAIAFGLGEFLSKVQSGQPFDICYRIEINDWNQQKRIQLNIIDLRFEE
jgi:single-stranded-DNA-specific exonuclease